MVERPTRASSLPSQGGIQPRHGSITTTSKVVEKLQSIGLTAVAWTGKCEAEKVSMGQYDVTEGEGGTYGLVFDNTFSKQTSKNVSLVLMTYPTNAPPKSGLLPYAQLHVPGSSTSVGKDASPSLRPISDSTESLPYTGALRNGGLDDSRPSSKGGHSNDGKGTDGSTFHTGILYKKRRRKGQGFAKRFFSLDSTSSTLSYYRNRHSSALRGAVPLSLAAIGANEKTREFSIDSGAEVWHLKAVNKKDYAGWKTALENACDVVNGPNLNLVEETLNKPAPPKISNPVEEREWERVEQLVSQVAGSRDAVRRLAKDTDPKYLPDPNNVLASRSISNDRSYPMMNESANSSLLEVDDPRSEKRPFWRRKSSADRSPSALTRRTISAQLAVPPPSVHGLVSPTAAPITLTKRSRETTHQPSSDSDIHERCMAVLQDLNNVMTEFAELIAESKQRRLPPITRQNTRLSLETVDSQEFFDAEDGDQSTSQLLDIRRSSEFGDAHEEHIFDRASEADSDSSSDEEDDTAGSIIFTATPSSGTALLFSNIPETLPPLPLPSAKRRATILAPKQAPPSIIGFLRKNAGKDLSTISMPVTANEPTSLLQRLAENLEYSHLLDSAASTSLSSEERLMYVAAFAVSNFANNRVKERATRKPFNPMLGETFELVREDLGFRFIAEKVSHHPVRMACKAESLNNGGWSFTQSPQPIQKFWGKSVELNVEGRMRVMLHGPDEHYSWDQATCFLRNVIAGEKYVEPVLKMMIVNETNGMRAVAIFKAGGMFSGRSEEVTVQLFDPSAPNDPLRLGLSGKWTDSLARTDTGAKIWTAGSVVPDANRVYGFTTFAATLNEVTAIEDHRLPPTDSRLRPDQKALENGDVDHAEALKARLEIRQRARGKVRESHGQTWTPQFFKRLPPGENLLLQDPDEEIWVLKQSYGYWDRRAAGDWSGIQEVFET